jgi:hypothetical protein
MARRIPTITDTRQLARYLKNWERGITPSLQVARTPKIPWNLKAEGKTNGILLTWNTVPGADGYEILRSANADPDFSTTTNITIIAVRQAQQDSYFDDLGAASVKRHYKIRATAGTISKPYSVAGPFSGIVTETSDSGTSDSDTTISDEFQGKTRDFDNFRRLF